MLTEAGLIESNFTELRINTTYTEIRQQYDAPKKFRMYFSQDALANMSCDTLALEGIPVESKQIVTKTHNLENQTVFVRRSPNAELTECRVIQEDDLLLQDVKTNRYFLAERRELEYVIKPERGGNEVTFVLKHSGKATVSYQTYGISWSPHYYLNILSKDEQQIFEAFAGIQNPTSQEYKINRAELSAGDVQIYARRCRKVLPRLDADDIEDESFHGSPSIPTIEPLEQLSDLHIYSIDQPFILLPNSSLSLPFIHAQIRLTKYVGLTLPFTDQTQTYKFQRKYRIESIDQYLPNGSLIIREDGRLVESTNLPNMAVGDKHTLSSGQDSDVSLNRRVRLISRQRNATIYAVHLTFKNTKSKPVNFKYEEDINKKPTQFTIMPKKSTDQQLPIQLTTNGISIGSEDNTHQSVLAANGVEQVYEYEIEFFEEKTDEPNNENTTKRRITRTYS